MTWKTPFGVENYFRMAFAILLSVRFSGGEEADVSWPPTLPDGKEMVTEVIEGVTVDFMFYPGQNYRGNPWSVWGEGLAVGDKYYSSIGDHIGPRGRAMIFEYDSKTKKLRKLVDLKEFLEKSGVLGDSINYTPGKVHGRIDLGSDGWLYYADHRGSMRTTSDAYGFKGSWIFRTHPKTGKTEIVASHPVPKHVVPNTVLDPDRLIFYGGTAAGKDAEAQGIQFFAYDCKNKKLLYSGPNGPGRYMIFVRSTGRLYFTPDLAGEIYRFDPAAGNEPVKIGGMIGLRSATQETPQGYVYTVSKDQDATLWRFNIRTEKAEKIGVCTIGGNAYITTIDADPTGRYLYYMPGAHGGAEGMGSPVVQYDLKTHKKRVIVHLHPHITDKYTYMPMGTFGSALSPEGDVLYVTWMGSRMRKSRNRFIKEACALTVVHLPAKYRKP